MTDREQFDRMTASKFERELDALIHSSVATYGLPAEGSQLAQRILNQIATEDKPPRTRRWLPWAIAIPITASLVIPLVLFKARPAHTPAGVTDQAGIPVQVQGNIPSIVPNSRESRKAMPRHTVRPSFATVTAKTPLPPKLDVFPTPQSLSPAERAFIAFTAQAPATERRSLVEAQQQTDAPIAIAAIKIQPIETPELGVN
jgi:hypothetical protein